MERYLGAKIKELRQSRNWTQAYLAERLNKSVSTVSGYESDAHPVPTDVLISIAELFGISLDALLGLERLPRNRAYPIIHARRARAYEKRD